MGGPYEAGEARRRVGNWLASKRQGTRSRRCLIESCRGARSNQGLKIANGKGRGRGSGVAECRTSALKASTDRCHLKTSCTEEFERWVGSSEKNLPEGERA
jgi:hypothetical protein